MHRCTKTIYIKHVFSSSLSTSVCQSFIHDNLQMSSNVYLHQDSPYAYARVVLAVLRKLLCVLSILLPALTGRANTDSLPRAPAPPFVNQSQSTRRCGGSVRATSMQDAVPCVIELYGFRAYLLRLC